MASRLARTTSVVVVYLVLQLAALYVVASVWSTGLSPTP